MLIKIDEKRTYELLKGEELSWTPSLAPFFNYLEEGIDQLYGCGGERLGFEPRSEEEFPVAAKNGTLPLNPDAYYEREVPGRFDWRNKDGKNYIGRVKQQGHLTACAAFAVTAAMESCYHIQEERPLEAGEAGLTLSRQHLHFYNAHALFGKIDPHKGWSIDSALEYAGSQGVLSTGNFPEYAPFNPAFIPPQGSLPENWRDLTYKINDYRVIKRVNGEDELSTGEMIKRKKALLVYHGPLLFEFTIFADLFLYESGLYSNTLPNVPPLEDRNHSVLCVGYDDDKEGWLCQNFWGTGWGEEGYFWIKYSACSIEERFFVINGVNYSC